MAAEAQTGLSMTLRPSSCWQVPRHSPTRGGRGGGHVTVAWEGVGLLRYEADEDYPHCKHGKGGEEEEAQEEAVAADADCKGSDVGDEGNDTGA